MWDYSSFHIINKYKNVNSDNHSLKTPKSSKDCNMLETFTKISHKNVVKDAPNLSCFLTSASVHTDRHTGVSSPRAPERSGGACCQRHRAALERSTGAARSTAWAPALRPWSPHRAAAVTPAKHHGRRESTSRTHRTKPTGLNQALASINPYPHRIFQNT